MGKYMKGNEGDSPATASNKIDHNSAPPSLVSDEV